MAAQTTSTKGVPGRRKVRRILEEEAYRRIIVGDVAETLSEFAAELSAWFKNAYPAGPVVSEASVEDALRDMWHRRHEMIGTEM